MRTGVDLMSKCPYTKICKHYRRNSFTCNKGDRGYCGIYRFFLINSPKFKENKDLIKENYS